MNKFDLTNLPSHALFLISKEDLERFAERLLLDSEEVKISSKEADEILTIDEAADFLNLARQTLYGYTSKRIIPFYKRNKRLYFKKSELLAWLEKGQQQTQEAEEQDVLNYLRSNDARRNK